MSEILPAEPASSATAPARSTGLWAFAFAWPLVVLASGLGWQQHVTAQREAAAMAARPPIAVIDGVALTAALGRGDTPEAKALDGLRQTRGVATRLRDDGYIVIDRRYLEAYPNAIEVKP